MNPPRLATAKASVDGSPATAGADGSPGRGMVATTIPSDDDDDAGTLVGTAPTTTPRPRKGGLATTDDRKVASGTALAGHRGAAPVEMAVVRASTPTGVHLTMDDIDEDHAEDADDVIDVDDDDIDEDADDDNDGDDDVDANDAKYGEDAEGFAETTAPSFDRPVGGRAPIGGMRSTKGRSTEGDRLFEKEARSAKGVSGAQAHSRDRSASGGAATAKTFQGKTGQGVSSADFFRRPESPVQKRGR